MDAYLYFGTTPFKLGPLTVASQSVWAVESPAIKVAGNTYRAVAVMGDNQLRLAPEADYIAIYKHSMPFSFPVETIWPEGMKPVPQSEIDALTPKEVPSDSPADTGSGLTTKYIDQELATRATPMARCMVLANFYISGQMQKSSNEVQKYIVDEFYNNLLEVIDELDIFDNADTVIRRLAYRVYNSNPLDRTRREGAVANWKRLLNAIVTNFGIHKVPQWIHMGNVKDLLDMMVEPDLDRYCAQALIAQATANNSQDLSVQVNVLTELNRVRIREFRMFGMTDDRDMPLFYLEKFFPKGIKNSLNPMDAIVLQKEGDVAASDALERWFLSKYSSAKNPDLFADMLISIINMMFPAPTQVSDKASAMEFPYPSTQLPYYGSFLRYLRNRVYRKQVGTDVTAVRKTQEYLLKVANDISNLASAAKAMYTVRTRASFVAHMISDVQTESGAAELKVLTDFIDGGMAMMQRIPRPAPSMTLPDVLTEMKRAVVMEVKGFNLTNLQEVKSVVQAAVMCVQQWPNYGESIADAFVRFGIPFPEWHKNAGNVDAFVLECAEEAGIKSKSEARLIIDRYLEQTSRTKVDTPAGVASLLSSALTMRTEMELTKGDTRFQLDSWIGTTEQAEDFLVYPSLTASHIISEVGNMVVSDSVTLQEQVKQFTATMSSILQLFYELRHLGSMDWRATATQQQRDTFEALADYTSPDKAEKHLISTFGKQKALGFSGLLEQARKDFKAWNVSSLSPAGAFEMTVKMLEALRKNCIDLTGDDASAARKYFVMLGQSEFDPTGGKFTTSTQVQDVIQNIYRPFYEKMVLKSNPEYNRVRLLLRGIADYACEMRPLEAPIRDTFKYLNKNMLDIANWANELVSDPANSALDAAYGTPSAAPDQSDRILQKRARGVLAYRMPVSGGSIGNYLKVVPSIPKRGLPIQILGKASTQMVKTVLAKYKGTRPIQDDIIDDLNANSEYIGLIKNVPLDNLLVVEGQGTSMLTVSQGGKRIGIMALDFEQLYKLFHCLNTECVLQAVTHELGHFVEKSFLKNTDRLEWNRNVSGRILHHEQKNSPYAYQTEQFAILAETMVWGNSVRGLEVSNGYTVASRYFANNFLTEEDAKKSV